MSDKENNDQLDLKHDNALNKNNVVDFADDNVNNDNFVKQESEDARLHRIAQMFQARTDKTEVKSENCEKIKKKGHENEKKQNKKTVKKNKKTGEKRTGRMIKKIHEGEQINAPSVEKKRDDSNESETDEDRRKGGKLPCCFRFLAVLIDRIRVKRAEKKHIRKSKGTVRRNKGLSVTFSDVVIEIPFNADDLTGNDFDEGVVEMDDVEISLN